MDLSDVTAVFANCCTLEFTRDLVRGLRRCYPELRFLIVDNGSYDESTIFLEKLSEQKGFEVLFNEKNLGHGPALNQAIRRVSTPLCLVLDSDVRVLKCGFLELMVPYFDHEPKLYILGSKARIPRGPKDAQRILEAHRKGTLDVGLFHCLLRRSIYLLLSPFYYHGSISTLNQDEAREKGYILGDFPIDDYLHHIGMGTLRILGKFRPEGPIDPRELRGH